MAFKHMQIVEFYILNAIEIDIVNREELVPWGVVTEPFGPPSRVHTIQGKREN